MSERLRHCELFLLLFWFASVVQIPPRATAFLKVAPEFLKLEGCFFKTMCEIRMKQLE